MNHLFRKKTAALFLSAVMMAASVSGCSGKDNAAQTETVTETAGESVGESEAGTVNNQPVNPDDVALKVGDFEVSAPEMFYYYLASRLQAEYTTTIDWTMEMSGTGGMTYGDSLKSLVESQVLQNAFWNSYAAEDGIELSDDDKETIEESLVSFNETISDEDRAFYGFNDDNVRTTLEHISIAGKVIEAEIQKQIEQFTEEDIKACTYRTVQHILLMTEAPAQTGESGETVEASEEEANAYKESQKAKAEEILERAKNGEDFKALADEFTADGGFEYSMNSDGVSPDGTSFVPEFTEGAFSLKEGEFTIVESQYGYHVMKLVSEDNKDYKENAQRNLAVSKYNDIYQQWLTDNAPEFYDGWKNFAVTNDPALKGLPAAETEETSEDAESESGESSDVSESVPESVTETVSESESQSE